MLQEVDQEVKESHQEEGRILQVAGVAKEGIRWSDERAGKPTDLPWN